MKILITLILLCIALSPAQGQQKKRPASRGQHPCGNAQTQFDMDKCFCEQYQKADAELNRVYQQLLAAGASNPVFIDKLKAAQRAWVVFRDAQLGAIYPITDNPKVQYGSVFPMCYCAAQEDLTVERTKQLKRMLANKDDDICGWDNH